MSIKVQQILCLLLPCLKKKKFVLVTMIYRVLFLWLFKMHSHANMLLNKSFQPCIYQLSWSARQGCSVWPSCLGIVGFGTKSNKTACYKRISQATLGGNLPNSFSRQHSCLGGSVGCSCLGFNLRTTWKDNKKDACLLTNMFGFSC